MGFLIQQPNAPVGYSHDLHDHHVIRFPPRSYFNKQLGLWRVALEGCTYMTVGENSKKESFWNVMAHRQKVGLPERRSVLLLSHDVIQVRRFVIGQI